MGSLNRACKSNIFLRRVRRAASRLRARRCSVRLSALSCFSEDTLPPEVFSGVGAPLPSPAASCVFLAGTVPAGGSEELGRKSALALCTARKSHQCAGHRHPNALQWTNNIAMPPHSAVHGQEYWERKTKLGTWTA